MCRLLAVVSRHPIDQVKHLEAFSRVCAESPEFQGHGWGCAVWRDDTWEHYRTVRPIWEDTFRPLGDVTILLAHARSAFRNEDIDVANNMPFISGEKAFIFNGELHGVRLPVSGRTGAFRLFQFILNLGRQATEGSIARAMSVIKRRTAHIRACNFILADARQIHVHSLFTTDERYFTMYRRQTADELVICSSPYPDDNHAWVALPNDSLEAYLCSF